ncbi:MAG: sensor histidine kinase [Oscillospiraceae bacterium]
MTGFAAIPDAVRSLLFFWSFLIWMAGAAITFAAIRQKAYARTAAAGVILVGDWLLLQIMADAIRGSRMRFIIRVNASGGSFALLCSAALLFLTIGCVGLYIQNRYYHRKFITPNSIKEGMDELPAGICYYNEDGRCILVNHRMNELCYAITGRDLQSGAVLFEAVRNKPVVVLPDGTVSAFRYRELLFEGEPINELIADDITELYYKAEALRRDNERIRKINESLLALGRSIEEDVRRREILQAKIDIHEEMNRLILAAKKSLVEESAEERRRILNEWQKNTLLLCREADSRVKNNVMSDMDSLASLIGLELVWDGTPDSEDTEVLRLFILAAREAMTNAVKHAGAGRLFISVKTEEHTLSAVFTNDGRVPDGPVMTTGGLANLKRKLAEAGGAMSVEASPAFQLTISIPEGEK